MNAISSSDSKAVIFDMDGVLVDSYEAHWISWRDTCADRGIPITKQRFAELFGRSFRDYTSALSPTPLDESAHQRWYDDKESAYRSIIEHDFPAIPGANPLIEDLARGGFLLGIGSSGPRGNVDCVLRHLPGAHWIRATVSADETTRAKPHPEPFLKCAELLNVHPANCAVIEDSIHGLQAARAAGMMAIGLTGTHPRNDLAPHADRVVESLTQLSAGEIAALLSQD